MGLYLDYADGQTPLDEDEKEGLRIPTIATRDELDEYEQHNIEQALQWILKSSFTAEKIFTETFLRDVHRKMYGDVWKWAGEFRTIGKILALTWSRLPRSFAHYWKMPNIG